MVARWEFDLPKRNAFWAWLDPDFFAEECLNARAHRKRLLLLIICASNEVYSAPALVAMSVLKCYHPPRSFRRAPVIC